ncbi:glycosyltransferase family 4 protein [Alicyclobacillus macrosporangiidus]|uniref:glycosyltransferase family 4 protein n=1 Tax=Alicyclobacillus macrosporangiidus TaxID=392015 RepID=UPI0009DD42C0|nr:glycosyltransferase family 4 protein [Alicyclobacillus macrosporangiidus]
MSRVVFLSTETFGDRMAGPAIRTWELASALARLGHEVTVASTSEIKRSANFRTAVYSARSLALLLSCADTFIIQNPELLRYGEVRNPPIPLVVDLYDPFILENLEVYKDLDMRSRIGLHRADLKKLLDLISIGDYFICASERQRFFWLGILSALNRICPSTYDDDPSGRSLIGVVPFGIPDDQGLTQQGQETCEYIPGLQPEDRLLVWPGGIWSWFDPLTLIKAMEILRDDMAVPVKLLFMGVHHPDPNITVMSMAHKARQLSDEKRLTGKYVFFNEQWVPYDKRSIILSRANIVVSTHFKTMEADLSFRTRLLDAIWAKRPIVSTEGGILSDWIIEHRLGLVVPPEDPITLAHSIKSLLSNDDMLAEITRNIEAFRASLRWARCVTDLHKFCMHPRFSPDRMSGKNEIDLSRHIDSCRYSSRLTYWYKMKYRFRAEGFRGVLKAIKKRLR